MPFVLAQRAPDRLFIGVDANAAGLRELSGRADRAGMRNLLYVRAAVEALPAELTGLADQVTVILPWGSLLAAVLRPDVPVLGGIGRLCRPNATLTVVTAIDPVRDAAELARLSVPVLDFESGACALAPRYAEAGLEIEDVRRLSRGELAGWPSTWARKLTHGGRRSAVQLRAAHRERRGPMRARTSGTTR